MNKDDLVGSLAYCGLICRLCFLAEHCDGCKTANNRCERNCSDEGCYQKICCERQAFDGCWQCAELSACEQGIYAQGDYSKVKAFALFIREKGPQAFARAVINNTQRGLSVEKGRDYDGKTIAAVLELLRQGV